MNALLLCALLTGDPTKDGEGNFDTVFAALATPRTRNPHTDPSRIMIYPARGQARAVTEWCEARRYRMTEVRDGALMGMPPFGWTRKDLGELVSQPGVLRVRPAPRPLNNP